MTFLEPLYLIPLKRLSWKDAKITIWVAKYTILFSSEGDSHTPIADSVRWACFGTFTFAHFNDKKPHRVPCYGMRLECFLVYAFYLVKNYLQKDIRQSIVLRDGRHQAL